MVAPTKTNSVTSFLRNRLIRYVYVKNEYPMSEISTESSELPPGNSMEWSAVFAIGILEGQCPMNDFQMRLWMENSKSRDSKSHWSFFFLSSNLITMVDEEINSKRSINNVAYEKVNVKKDLSSCFLSTIENNFHRPDTHFKNLKL